MADKQKRGQKYGRNGRAPSCKMQQFRTDRNKRLKQERHARRLKEHAAKKLRVARGTARNARRLRKQQAWEHKRQAAFAAA